MSARILDCTIDEYHADPMPEPSLSASIGKLLVDSSPLHAHSAHPRLGGVHRKSTKAMDRGTLMHRLILGKGADLVVLNFDDYKKKDAQAERDAARAAGKIPVLAGDLEDAVACTHVVKRELRAHGVVLSGQSEVAVTWDEPVPGTDETVACRAMFDHAIFELGQVFDLKKISSAHPDKCTRQISDYGYDIQWAAYTSAMRALKPELAGREQFAFLFFEEDAPFAVTPIKLDGQFRALGQARWEQAVSLWHSCMKSGEWPGYTGGIIEVAPTPWALSKALFQGIEVGV